MGEDAAAREAAPATEGGPPSRCTSARGSLWTTLVFTVAYMLPLVASAPALADLAYAETALTPVQAMWAAAATLAGVAYALWREESFRRHLLGHGVLLPILLWLVALSSFAVAFLLSRRAPLVENGTFAFQVWGTESPGQGSSCRPARYTIPCGSSCWAWVSDFDLPAVHDPLRLCYEATPRRAAEHQERRWFVDPPCAGTQLQDHVELRPPLKGVQVRVELRLASRSIFFSRRHTFIRRLQWEGEPP